MANRQNGGWARAVATCGYVGFLPFIPGTWGSAVGWACCWLVRANTALLGVVTALSLALGYASSGRAARQGGRKDPGWIVIDEFAGMCLSLLAVPFSLQSFLAGFFLFRLLDTLKPVPADRIQELPGSRGIMGDDVIAAVYTNLILQGVFRFACPIAS